ncbi:LLM class flavin-dependent oxidoreductase [Rhodococcus sp. NPDC003318]|uniref:LLM class flavin-dependent oxidoreductase n=1 Tax=Rhodococcus sp. NPDC003318 TaxID=3364503 RepID=UPI0036AF74F2
MTYFVTRYDFRAPGYAADARGRLFALALDQAAYVDRHGHAALTLSEHHGSDDGYLPSPLLAASAFAARTTRIPISVAALVVNLYEPLRLAEDIAVLDHLSGGRVTYTVGLGYRPQEYALFGRPWKSRARDLEVAMTRIFDAWGSGTVTPAPLTAPHPVMFYGGGVPASAVRAARLGLHFQPEVADRALKRLYVDECRARGREPGLVMLPPPGPATVFCADDPDAFWAKYGHHLLADALAYRAWIGDRDSHVKDGSTTVDELRSAGVYQVHTPDELIALCRSGEITVVTSHPLCGGMPEEPSWESLRLISETVLPSCREGSAPRTGADPSRHCQPFAAEMPARRP